MVVMDEKSGLEKGVSEMNGIAKVEEEISCQKHGVYLGASGMIIQCTASLRCAHSDFQ